MTVVDLKRVKPKRASRDLVEIDKSSGAWRYYDKMRRDIISDLAGRRNLTRIELEWIDAFCFCSTRLKYLNFQTMLGDTSECDVSQVAQLASTMLRIGSKLNVKHREPGRTFGEVLVADYEQRQREEREEKQRASEEATTKEGAHEED